MIVSISQEYIFEHDKEPIEHKHRPYFLCKGVDIPKLDNKIIDIGPVEEYDSWVNWGEKVPVRKVYLSHPRYTPAISNMYYKKGYENYENAVPYIQRVISDFCAQGKWPLNTNNDTVILNCLIYDFELVNGFVNCCGIGEFKIGVTSSMNLDEEKFDISFTLYDKEPKVTQLLANNINEELDNIILPLIRIMKRSHILIGHNIISFDNQELLDRLREYKSNKEIKEFINKYTYSHKAFYRGRISNSVEIYPISFDTLLASKFLFKDFAEGQYGLKVLSPALGIDVTGYDNRSNDFDKRILERDFGGFGNWDNNNPLCLQYNKDDIYETFGIFTKMYKEILTYMFITGMPFQDVVSGSNTKIADYMSLIRCYNKKICPPVLEPIKVARALMYHFKGETPGKEQIFEFFRNHECNQKCLTGFKAPDNLERLDEAEDIPEDIIENEEDIKHFDNMINKLYRCVRYGREMPDYVEYYPLLLDYLSVGGLVYQPKVSIQPLHNVFKADVSAQYPSILKAKNIVCDTVRLCKPGEKPDGWCWFRSIGNTSILDKFEWKYADEEYVDKKDEYPKQYFIGYKQKGEEGVITKALTGIMEMTAKYKKIPEWQDVYQRTLKPLRNAMTHGILLALEATSMQYNICGTAIPTFGQIISNVMVKEYTNNGWMLLEADTDGAEFIKIKDDAKDFESIIKDVEEYWFKELNYPISFDIELHEHKLYLAHKNYVTIKNNKVKLTGATLHASDKPNIAENTMKKLMMQILPISNTKEEFLNNVRKYASKILNEQFKEISIKDLVMISSVKPVDEYTSTNFKLRAQAIEKVLNRVITFPTKIEFLVCKKVLPDVPANKTSSDPISYMWPREIVESQNLEIDYNWYKDMVYSYIDSCFGLEKSSSRHAIKSLVGFDDASADSQTIIQHIEIPKKIKPKQTRLF